MSDYEDKILGDHSYDGIQEYDNPMPGWWKALFLATIIWSVIYFFGIQLGVLPRYDDDLKQETLALNKVRTAYEAAQPPMEITDAVLLAALGDEAMIAQGQKDYATFCAECHASRGEGKIGPNLTDKYWLYGATPHDLLTSIRDGRPNGMPGWGSVLLPQQLVSMVAYLDTMRGQDLPGKEPQGEPVAPAAPVDPSVAPLPQPAEPVAQPADAP